MCGILVVLNKQEKIDVRRGDQALEKLRLRGPDFSFRDILFHDRLYFGQTVLSITGKPSNLIDVYHKSHGGRFNLIFNGEIYNYQQLSRRFLEPRGITNPSGTDTEVLVNLHEVLAPAAVYGNLEGMFGYIVYDNLKKTLTIGRDRIGEKVLYLFEDEHVLMIASEVGPILELNPQLTIDRDIVRQYFFTRHLLTPKQTAFRGITVIPPGHVLEYDLERQTWTTLHVSTVADFIKPEKLEQNSRRTIDELALELEDVMQASAQAIAPKDVSYSSVFSGGLDSSLASWFMQQALPPAHFVALQFPGKDAVSENLAPFEKILGRPIETFVVDLELYRTFLERVYQAAGAPLPTHSFISQAIVGKIVRDLGSKVWIGGHGGDELFGGYEFYKKLAGHQKFPDQNPSAYSGFVPLGFEFQNWQPEKLQAEIADRWQECSRHYAFLDDAQDRLVQTVLLSDMTVMLESVGIREADTMSMLSSVEPRCFFLTKQMIEFAVNLPARCKIDLQSSDANMITRPLVKQVFLRHFGKALLLPKQGFSGFPNEAGRSLVDKNFPLVRSELGLREVPSAAACKDWQALEWKLINTELFLQNFLRYF